MRRTLNALKDKGLATGLKAWLNEQYKAYGSVRAISVDTEAKRMALTLDLLGEPEPVELALAHYEIVTAEGATALRLGRIESSRSWLAAVLNDLADRLLDERTYPVENRAAAELMRTLL